MWSKAVAVAAVKLVFISTLFGIFLGFFGMIQVQEYMKKEIFVSVSKIGHPDGVPLNKMKVCALNPKTGKGWKDENFDIDKCNTSTNITECILNATYTATDFLRTDQKYLESTINNDFEITEEITALFFGNCVSFEGVSAGIKMVSNFGKKPSDHQLPFDKNFIYTFFFHDPGFFFISGNPKANPGLRIDLYNYQEIKTLGSRFVNIEIIQHEKLNLDTQPCVTDETYRFDNCLRLHLESKAGCRLPWHEKIYGKRVDMKTCTTLEEFKTITMEKGYGFGGYQTMEIKDIVRDTGCLTPCNYREIKEAAGPNTNFMDDKTESGIFLWGPTIVSTDIRKEREKPSLPLSSLVGNIGGTLGLFLGFSFLLIWDWIEWTYNFVMARNVQM